MSLAVSHSFRRNEKHLASASLPDNAYVLSLVALHSQYAASASAPSNLIQMFDKANLRKIQTLTGHPDAVTCLRASESIAGNQDVLISCGKDGTVRAWDARSGAVAIEMSTAGRRRALLSCDASPDGLMVAAGTEFQGDDALLLYWDPRNPVAPLRTHASTHSEDITSIKFAPAHSTRHVLLSASSDGLISTSNADEDDEDEAVLHVGNWGCSISRTGWINNAASAPDVPCVWAASDMETFSSWSGELDLLRDMDRRQFTLPGQDLTWVTDYLIDCHSSSDGSLHLFAGSNEGDIAMMSSHPSGANRPWSIDQMFSTKHEGVVRCVLWDEANGIVLSGGEDSQINVWSCPMKPAADNNNEMDIDSPRKRTYTDRGEDDINGVKRYRTV